MKQTDGNSLSAADQRMRMRAVYACSSAEVAYTCGDAFDINALSEETRQAAHALLYSAIGHWLSASGKRKPKTFIWKSRRWSLANVGLGRLQVSAMAGNPGIVSRTFVIQ